MEEERSIAGAEEVQLRQVPYVHINRETVVASETLIGVEEVPSAEASIIIKVLSEADMADETWVADMAIAAHEMGSTMVKIVGNPTQTIQPILLDQVSEMRIGAL